jgi:N-acetylneuraminic acid mutarotase
MPTARGALAVAVIGNKIYAAGGSPPARERDFAVYDPAADTWATLPPMPTPRNHLTAGASGEKFYAVGGRSGGIQGAANAMEEFDPMTNTWTQKAPLPTARSGIAGVVVNGCLYVFGGEGNTAHPQGVFAQAEAYNPVTNTWQAVVPMPVPRHGIGAAAIGPRIYIPGGGPVQGFGVTDVHEVFDTDITC